MTDIETDILRALQTAGIAAVAQSVDTPATPLKIKPIGRTMDEPIPERYFEFVQIKNNRNDDYHGDERIYQGTFRILLHWQLGNDEGVYAPTTLLGRVANYFPKNKRLVSGQANVQIYAPPDQGSSISSGAELIFPLSLLYRCFRA